MFLPFFFLVSLFSSQEVKFHNTCDQFLFKDNSVLLTASVSGVPQTFILDFGRNESAIANNANNSSVYSIKTATFSGNAKFTNVALPVAECSSLQKPANKLGFDFFRKSRQVFRLDFDTSIFCCLSQQQVKPILQDGYAEIKSDFRSDGVYVTILIKRKPYVLKVDTGFSGTIAMNANDAETFIKEPCKSYENNLGRFGVYPNKWVTFSEDYYNSVVAVTDTGTSRLGMGLIKGFNWIIDFRKQKIFIKKNSIAMDSENVFPPSIETAVQNGKLIVVSINPRVIKANIGDGIANVNGIPVTSENVCELMEMINKASEQSSLNFQFFRDD